MELSTSQLVPDKPRGDASVWAQSVVGAEQFAPAAKPRDRRALWFFVAFVVLSAIAGTATYLLA